MSDITHDLTSGTEAFVAEVGPLLRGEVAALHDGDLAPRLALWSRRDPVTLFGAWFTARGWSAVDAAFARLANTFRSSESLEYEVVAAGVSGDLGYVVAFEHSSVRTVDGQRSYTLRVTTVLRREEGAWKVVHRHGDDVAVIGPET
ncbi:MAG TPA: nuclear transport factor 2 family protein [Nocardioidaceae bacterium]|nr:nuclear transport factor 2 family protein [Nocardioidaceae bacterium]